MSRLTITAAELRLHHLQRARHYQEEAAKHHRAFQQGRALEAARLSDFHVRAAEAIAQGIVSAPARAPRVHHPSNPALYIEHELLEFVEPKRVQAALVKYEQDGGGIPATFKVLRHWPGAPECHGVTLTATVDGHPWALML